MALKSFSGFDHYKLEHRSGLRLWTIDYKGRPEFIHRKQCVIIRADVSDLEMRKNNIVDQYEEKINEGVLLREAIDNRFKVEMEGIETDINDFLNENPDQYFVMEMKETKLCMGGIRITFNVDEEFVHEWFRNKVDSINDFKMALESRVVAERAPALNIDRKRHDKIKKESQE